MDTKTLKDIKAGFDDYVRGFAQQDLLPPPLELKRQHSQRVAQECRLLAAALDWPDAKQRTAEALGLLHDLGRFSQYAQYGSFADDASVDHGERGFAIATDCVRLSRLPETTRRAILFGIRHHNDRTLPTGISGPEMDFLRLVRDADKLDIFRVVLAELERDGFQSLPAMLPHIALRQQPSPEVVTRLLRSRSCSFDALRTLGDLLLMQLCWIYDLNLSPSLRMVRERRIPERLLRHIDGDKGCQEIAAALHRHLHRGPMD